MLTIFFAGFNDGYTFYALALRAMTALAFLLLLLHLFLRDTMKTFALRTVLAFRIVGEFGNSFGERRQAGGLRLRGYLRRGASCRVFFFYPNYCSFYLYMVSVIFL
jgi:hypothetical protein